MLRVNVKKLFSIVVSVVLMAVVVVVMGPLFVHMSATATTAATACMSGTKTDTPTSAAQMTHVNIRP